MIDLGDDLPVVTVADKGEHIGELRCAELCVNRHDGGRGGLRAVAMKSIPMGTAYAVWTGVGAVGGFVAGIALFGESASAMRIASAALIVAGIVGLKLAR